MRILKKVFKLFLILAFSLTVYSCDKTTTTRSYLDVDYSDFVGQFIEDAEEQLNMPENDYYIYYYGPDCYACETVKAEVLDTLYRAKNVKVYLVTVTSSLDINPSSGVKGTPTIIRVTDNQVSEFHEGSTAIKNMLNEIN